MRIKLLENRTLVRALLHGIVYAMGLKDRNGDRTVDAIDLNELLSVLQEKREQRARDVFRGVLFGLGLLSMGEARPGQPYDLALERGIDAMWARTHINLQPDDPDHGDLLAFWPA